MAYELKKSKYGIYLGGLFVRSELVKVEYRYYEELRYSSQINSS
jgi:hypothetical protein